ncbi:ImmA/IrrE family metallo-endopeptidase [Marimonas lutisalis]|uniref:ImmA/IrrE family metallo-endopeptidase n=1 Tax=Marimonas lutisalis TaxID=2545756 RepID=UPI0010F85FB3|nr:XRE family transcriptional regulator [Marimonas lutisalis]
MWFEGLVQLKKQYNLSDVEMPNINPDITIWARETAGYDLIEASQVLGISENSLSRIESGEKEPTRNQIKKMAAKYRRPLVTFYLRDRPRTSEAPKDFRKVVDPIVGEEARIFALYREIGSRQSIVRSMIEEDDEVDHLEFVGSLKSIDNVFSAAETIEDILGFTRHDFRREKSVDLAFSALRQSAEQAGIFVILQGHLGHYTTSIPVSAFRGFALADDIAPFIVINEYDSKSAWSFTLLHELCHILLGQSGISGYNSESKVEAFCDRVAAAFLVSEEDFDQLDKRSVAIDPHSAVNEISKNWNVSRLMVAYNLAGRSIISWPVYEELQRRFESEREERRHRKRDGHPSPYVVKRHRLGKALVNLVGEYVASGIMTSSKAALVLGVKPTAVGKLVSGG